MNSPKLFAIIPNWNTKELLRNCLNSLRNSDYGDFEIIVVDNASSDGSVKMVKNEFSRVHLIQNQQNLGFAKAVNQGINFCLSFQPSREDFTGNAANTTNPYFLLLNSDTLVEKNSISLLVDFLEKNPKVGIVGPKLKNADGSWQSSARNFPNVFTHFVEILGLTKRISQLPLAKLFFRNYYMLWEYPKSQKVDWLMGAALMVRAEAVREVGLMDEYYFMYGEEMDWQYQFAKKGWEIWYYPEAEITHLGGKSTEKVKEKSLKWQLENFEYFTKKNYGWLNHQLLKLITKLGLMLMVWRMKDLNQKEIYRKLLSNIGFCH